jgi:hypothetical protein
MSTTKIDDLLNSVGVQQTKLDELEQYYKENKESITKQLASYIQDLAVLSDSQAIRATVIRELYWEKQVPASIIGNSFGVTIGRIKKIAGSKTVNFPCDYQCGNFISKTFESRNELENHLIYERKWRRRQTRENVYFHICDNCRKREENKKQEEAARRRLAHRQRNEQLRAMSWEDFTETKEWIDIRNLFLYERGDKCEIYANQ